MILNQIVINQGGGENARINTDVSVAVIPKTEASVSISKPDITTSVTVALVQP